MVFWNIFGKLGEGVQGSSDDGNGDRRNLVVRKVQNDIGVMVVNELDAEDLCVWEGSFDRDCKIGRGWLLLKNLLRLP